MPDLQDGQRVEVRGSTAIYTLERRGDVRSCTCPAWRNQSAPPERRTCKHLRAYLGEAAAPIRIAPRPAWVPQVREDREVRTRRRAALAQVVERFPLVHDKMQLVYGLRMPRHLAYAIGWWEGLTREERDEAWAYVGTGPCGVADWFEPGGLELRVTPGLDERLHYRYRRDPPEFISVFGGNSDGSHWGLWYDDPAELPRAIAHNWARDSAETYPREPTLLGDREAVAALLADPPPREALEALVTLDLAMLDTLLAAPGMSAGGEDAQLAHLGQLAFWRDRGDTTYAEQRAPHQRALYHLLDHCGCGGRVLEAALGCEEAGVLDRVLAAVDLTWRSSQSATGAGADAKLVIRFADGVKNLLAKFVTRK